MKDETAQKSHHQQHHDDPCAYLDLTSLHFTHTRVTLTTFPSPLIHSLSTIDDLHKIETSSSSSFSSISPTFFQTIIQTISSRFIQVNSTNFPSHTSPAPWLLIDASPITPAQKRLPTSAIRLKQDKIQYCVVYLSPLVLPCRLINPPSIFLLLVSLLLENM